MGMSLQVTVNFEDGTDEELESGIADLASLGGMVPTMLEAAKITAWSSLQIIIVSDAALPIGDQPAPTADGGLANDLGGRMPGHDANGNYSTAQMMRDEMSGGDTGQPLDD